MSSITSNNNNNATTTEEQGDLISPLRDRSSDEIFDRFRGDPSRKRYSNPMGGNTSAGCIRPYKAKHPLEHTYSMWFFRKTQGPKSAEAYEKSIKKIGDFSTVEDFWGYYSHLIRPSDMPIPSDYHLFRDGIKPMWEDPANKQGGKWIVRLKKGLADIYWEDLVLAVIGNRFEDEICGVVISIREHDIISVWNKDAQDREACRRIRDTIRRVLKLPPNTQMEYKAHDASIKDHISFRSASAFGESIVEGILGGADDEDDDLAKGGSGAAAGSNINSTNDSVIAGEEQQQQQQQKQEEDLGGGFQ